MKKAFTLLELLVVIAMIMILAGAFTSSVVRARERARIARATQEIREMTNAILSYENYARNHELDVNGGWAECTESAMAMILGKKQGDNGEDIPVLYNGHVTNGRLRDPWGRPYQYLIQKTSEFSGNNEEKTALQNMLTAGALPNANRLPEKERVSQ